MGCKKRIKWDYTNISNGSKIYGCADVCYKNNGIAIGIK